MTSRALLHLFSSLAPLLLTTALGCGVEIGYPLPAEHRPGDPIVIVPPASTVARVSAKWGHVCRIDADHRLSCWGQNFAGELGVPGAATFEPSPRAVDPEHRYREVSAGVGTTCAIREEGTLHCWGRNHGGPLATGDTDPRDSPVQIGEEQDWEAVSMGSGMACGLRDGGKLFCWGGEDDGWAAQPPLSPEALTAPTQVPGQWLAVASHWYRTMAIRTDGTLWTSDNDGSFTPVPGFSGEAAAISVGVLHALVVDRRGALFHLDFFDSPTPVLTPELPSVTFGEAMASNYGACAISADQRMYCSADLTYQVPQLAPLGDDLPLWTGVGVGNGFGCGVTADASIQCWGTLHSDTGTPSMEYGPAPTPID